MAGEERRRECWYFNSISVHWRGDEAEFKRICNTRIKGEQEITVPMEHYRKRREGPAKEA
jgi:hypothetical protein